MNLIFPTHSFRKLFHDHNSNSTNSFEVCFGNSTQGVFSGMSSQGGLNGMGHAPYSSFLVQYFLKIWHQLSNDDKKLSSTKDLIGHDLSNLYSEARDIYRICDLQGEYPPDHC
jgi:hypothetical protein